MDYAIQETFTLPSNGIIYGEESVDPHITLRSMSTVDEMARLSPSELPYKSLADLIDSCTVSGPGISAYDMCMGDFQFLLYKLRIVTYGPDYKVQITCPYCGYRSEDTLDLGELEIKEADEEVINKYSEFVLPVAKNTITLNFETPRMVDIISEKAKAPKKKDAAGQNQTLLYTICQFIKTIDGIESKPSVIEEWVKKLSMKDVNTIIAYADKLNVSIGVQTKIPVVCDVCRLPFSSQVKTTSEFFRPTLDI